MIELRENYATLREAIEVNLLSVNGTLYEEPMQLFKDDIKDIVKTSTIMSYGYQTDVLLPNDIIKYQ